MKSFYLVPLAFLACTTEQDLGNKPDGANTATDVGRTEAEHCDRRLANGDAGTICDDTSVRKNCSEDYACAVEKLAPAAASRALDCFEKARCSSLSCFKNAGLATDNSMAAIACAQRVNTCMSEGSKIDDDVCSVLSGASATFSAAIEACLSKPCSEVANCFESSIGGCNFQ